MRRQAYVLEDGAGTPVWFAGALMVLKASGEQTGGQFALLDQHVGPGYTVPLHVHHEEDEAWYVLEGEATFYCGDERFTAGKGAWVFLPQSVPHSFRVTSDGARLLTFSVPARFGDFVQAAGSPAPSMTLPPPLPEGEMEPMIAQMAEIAARHGIDLVGPPPEA